MLLLFLVLPMEFLIRLDTTGLDAQATSDLISWLSASLSGKAAQVKITKKLEAHPCVVTVEEMGAARHFVRTQFQSVPEEQRYQMLQPQLEINPKYNRSLVTIEY